MVSSNINSQQVLSDISSSLPAAIFIYSLDSHGKDKVQYISDGCFSIWGVASEEVMNDAQKLWDIIHPDDIETMAKSVQESAEQLSHWECEWRITPYGSSKIKWLRGYGTPRADEDGTIVWNSVILDITEEQEAKLAEQNALKNTINVLISALEARDPYTAGHGRSVAKIAELIGKKLGLCSHHIEGIALGALIHDVGKISTPAEILTKPSALLDAEFELIKLHPNTGSKFFAGINFNWPISEMIEQHHERLDGSGYPKGLKGHEISFEARIIAVADVIDSMSTSRPYRFAPGLEAAIKTLTEGRGTKFDEKIVDTAVELYNEKALEV